MGDDQLLNLQPGTVVNGRYEIVKCLGTGSMGMVYACRHRELAGHLVAMKVLFSEVARDSVQAARFRNEIVASYGVNHPHVVRAYEYFRDGDLIAFTMEYVGGGDLADRISMEEPMTIPEIVRMLSQMCSGVQAIHSAGIVHRDLKPENILITAQGDIKITDFGIARTGTGPKLTEHGGVVGTIDYVSPEYLERGQVDQRSDVYALGVLGYEMITAETPFKGKSVIETMTMRLRSDPTPPHKLRADCPPELGAVIQRAMARDPEQRYQSAADMLADLSALESGGAVNYAPQRAAEENGPRQVAIQELRVPLRRDRKSSLRSAQPQLKTNRRVVAEMFPDVQPLESVLKSQPELNVISGGEPSGSHVAVSQSHLSAERIRELSSDIHREDSLAKTIFWWLFIMMIGFGVGLYVLSQGWYKSDSLPLGENQSAETPE